LQTALNASFGKDVKMESNYSFEYISFPLYLITGTELKLEKILLYGRNSAP